MTCGKIFVTSTGPRFRGLICKPNINFNLLGSIPFLEINTIPVILETYTRRVWTYTHTICPNCLCLFVTDWRLSQETVLM